MKSFVPLYQRIQESIRADYLAGADPSTPSRLPTERVLQARYSVSRPTISKAIAALAAEGMLVKSQGRGTFAVSRPVASDGAGLRRIGFVAPLSDAPLVQRSFRGIDRVAHRRDYRVVISGAGDDLERERLAVHDLVAAGARGLVIYPAPRRPSEVHREYLVNDEIGVPVVLIDTCLPSHGHTQVVFDNEHAGYAMASWLLSRGYRRIGILTFEPATAHGPLAARLRGYKTAFAEYGASFDAEMVRGVDPDHQTNDIAVALQEWFSAPEPPSAIIAPEDMAAMETIDLLVDMGFRVPEDIRVVGYDNREAAHRFRPPFPTTNPDFERMGQIACQLLLDMLETGRAPLRTYVLDVPLLVRRGPEASIGIHVPSMRESNEGIGTQSRM